MLEDASQNTAETEDATEAANDGHLHHQGQPTVTTVVTTVAHTLQNKTEDHLDHWTGDNNQEVQHLTTVDNQTTTTTTTTTNSTEVRLE